MLYKRLWFFGFEVQNRRSHRGDMGNKLVLVRNFPTDFQPTLFKTHSQSFKKSYFYRAVYNYNLLRRYVDQDSYSFTDLRCILSLFNYDTFGFVIV